MIACYDLSRCPPTYDAVAFLALAEQERLRRGEEFIDLHILPGPAGGFRADSLWPHSIEERVQMRERVLLPLCSLLPSVRSISVHESYAEARKVVGWGVGEYYVGLPRIVEALKANSRPLRFPPIVAGLGKAVTFTLREAEHWPLRNSQVEEWLLAAEELAEKGIPVIVIRDACKAATPFFGQCISHLTAQYIGASTDLLARAEIYSTAMLNVGISNGPMWMSIFMDAPTLMLRPTTNAAGGCYDDAFYARSGIRRGTQLPNSLKHQRLVWEEDTCENIVRSVQEFLNDQMAA